MKNVMKFLGEFLFNSFYFVRLNVKVLVEAFVKQQSHFRG